jgi:hypothetical protein
MGGGLTCPSYNCYFSTRVAYFQDCGSGSLSNVYDAEVKYRSLEGSSRYGSLQELGAVGLIDSDLAKGEKHGYRFELVATPNSFEAHATPMIYGRYGFKATGRHSYYINEKRLLTNVDKKGAKAGPEDEPVGEQLPPDNQFDRSRRSEFRIVPRVLRGGPVNRALDSLRGVIYDSIS